MSRGQWSAFGLPPLPPRQQLSAFGLPPLPPPAADVICERPPIANTFREHRVEGIILLTDSSQSVLPPPSFKGLPSILVNCFDSSCQIPSVMPDDEVGGYLSAKSAFEKGHIRLGFLSDPKDFFTGKTRSIGFRKAHEEM